MAERKYVCIRKCYYLSRLWNPEKPGIEADSLLTDRDDVPPEWFQPISGSRKKTVTKI